MSTLLSNPKTTLYEKQVLQPNIPNASISRAPEATTRKFVSLNYSKKSTAGEEAPYKALVNNGTPCVEKLMSSKQKELSYVIDLLEFAVLKILL